MNRNLNVDLQIIFHLQYYSIKKIFQIFCLNSYLKKADHF